MSQLFRALQLNHPPQLPSAHLMEVRISKGNIIKQVQETLGMLYKRKRVATDVKKGRK